MNSKSTIHPPDQWPVIVGKRLLVIDDDPATRIAVTKVLRLAEASVTSADGIAEAMALMPREESPFDLVVTDLRMPIMSGKSVLCLVKGLYPKVPVLMMSAFWTDETREECRKLGATGLLDKPLNSMRLLSAVVMAVFGAQ